jgi:hypothetical protein
MQLSCFPLGPLGGEAVCACLDSGDACCKSVDLSFCEIGPSACLLAASALIKGQITELNISNDRVGEVGGLALADALRKKPKGLRKLLLGGNKIGDKACVAFASVVDAPSLLHLDLW